MSDTRHQVFTVGYREQTQVVQLAWQLLLPVELSPWLL